MEGPVNFTFQDSQFSYTLEIYPDNRTAFLNTMDKPVKEKMFLGKVKWFDLDDSTHILLQNNVIKWMNQLGISTNKANLIWGPILHFKILIEGNVLAFTLLFWSISGLLMWWQMKRLRFWGAITVASGVFYTGVIIYLMILFFKQTG